MPSYAGAAHPVRAFRAISYKAALAALLLFCACLWARAALAHGVYIFAWPEPGRLCSDSYFSKKSKVRGGAVSMHDETGALLGEGRSDETGRICFDAPGKAGDLLFVVQAGQGHRAEFLLPAARVAEALPLEVLPMDALPTDVLPPGALPADVLQMAAASSPAAVQDGAGRAEAPSTENAVANGVRGPVISGAAASVSVTPPEAWEARMRAVIREELQRELAPLRAEAAEAKSGPNARDILGGLGWIIGLAGLGAWLASRRKGGCWAILP